MLEPLLLVFSDECRHLLIRAHQSGTRAPAYQAHASPQARVDLEIARIRACLEIPAVQIIHALLPLGLRTRQSLLRLGNFLGAERIQQALCFRPCLFTGLASDDVQADAVFQCPAFRDIFRDCLYPPDLLACLLGWLTPGQVHGCPARGHFQALLGGAAEEDLWLDLQWLR